LARILVVDDEPRLVTLLRSALAYRGHDVVGVTTGAEALDLAGREPFALVLTDLRMEPVDGMAVIAGVKERSPDTAVIVLTAYGDVPTAVAALQAGAAHYLTKPINFDEVAHVVERTLVAAALAQENHDLRRAVHHLGADPGLIGDAPATRRLRELIAKVAPGDTTVLVRGESGAGKEVVARAIHAASGRHHDPFLAVNCAAIAESLLESELFGYRKGAFTGADSDREGLFEAARGGTVFLDEIGEAGPGVQAKLLRVLETRTISRVGDPRERPVVARVVAATNRPLEGVIREDLYYRLVVFPIDVPPLRERLEDLEALALHFLGRFGRRERALPAGALRRLREHAWPGNVRELRNVLERAHILAGADPLRDEHILIDAAALAHPAIGPDLNLDDNARALILAAIARAGGNKAQAARMLGITRRTLYSRMKLLNLEVQP
jgi:DNA-binding NtrC family response regulator